MVSKFAFRKNLTRTMVKESFKKSHNKNNIQFSKFAIVIEFIGQIKMETFRTLEQVAVETTHTVTLSG